MKVFSIVVMRSLLKLFKEMGKQFQEMFDEFCKKKWC
nr:MAG TPA: hypothetical protein [Caudoviricetes sp.]